MQSLRRPCRIRRCWALLALLTCVPSDTAGLYAQPSSTRIVAIADIHGDADAFRAILRRASLIDEKDSWIGGTATLVQTGDFTDRGPKVREVMELLMSLEQSARSGGGRFVSLMGNHEAMNLLGDTRDVTPEIYASFADEKSESRRADAYDALVSLAKDRAGQFKSVPAVYQPPSREEWMAEHPPGLIEYREAMEPDGRYGRWLRGKDVVAKVGDTIFLHGGIDPSTAPPKLEDINAKVRDEIAMFDRTRRMMIDRKLILPFFTFTEMVTSARAELEAVVQSLKTENNAPAEARIGASLTREELLDLDAFQSGFSNWHLLSPGGPLWFRGYAMWKPEEGASALSQLLARYDASHIAVGHTPTDTLRITTRFSGSIFLMDTGMLSAFYPGGRASALEIRDGTFRALYVDSEEVLFPERAAAAPGRRRVPVSAPSR